MLKTFLAAAAIAVVSFSPATAGLYEERLAQCFACHGDKGRSMSVDVPSLGGQPAPYLLIQLYMFREKLRHAEPMNEMAEGLADADLQRFAETMSRLPAPTPTEQPNLARAERAEAAIAQYRCAFCHGAQFVGGDAIPRLAVQREDYLLATLRSYKAGDRREYQPVMNEIVRGIDDGVLADLAYYLARFPSR